jgi:putative hydrolase
VGIESNIRGIDGKADLEERDFENFDIYFCGKHVCIWYDKFADYFRYGVSNFWFDKFGKVPSKKLVERNTKAYINTIKNNPIDAITHLNFLCPSNALEVAKCAADYGTYIELNSKKTHLTDDELNDIIQKTSVRFIVDSDAHSSGRIGDTKLVDEQLRRLQFPMERIDNIDGKYPSFRFSEFKKKR